MQSGLIILNQSSINCYCYYPGTTFFKGNKRIETIILQDPLGVLQCARLQDIISARWYIYQLSFISTSKIDIVY